MQKERSCHYRKCLKEPNGQMGEIYSSKMGDDFDQCGCIKRNEWVNKLMSGTEFLTLATMTAILPWCQRGDAFLYLFICLYGLYIIAIVVSLPSMCHGGYGN